ncbi:MAG: TIGR01777 family oxidoreductase [Prosthecochloris sp.]|uniref:TIGR01777 family oxidoreductase n=1 Tax=unclassified Prosthecochloris TaxID=2632826 RepID=UPI000DF762CC|nr:MULTISPECIES: TIGR01777 family oxidoreductase [unclassified Prosthecochloris]MCW8798811.1 TIGR01777 family oxidoreductase [Prosthecochloris sp.]NEX12335.1 TIGR01777 family protein [Prosthecochloris sp.]RDD31157.1 TIGR01777 family protein [Prosthecochloris sp. ZM]
MEGQIVITGATGVIGSVIAGKLIAAGEKVVVFSRSPQGAELKLPGAAAYVKWDSDISKGDWNEYIDGAKAVIHLAGKPLLDERWSEEHKVACYESRVLSTRYLVDAINAAKRKPGVFISSSAVGYYGSFENCSDTLQLTEDSPEGDDFLAKICYDWEKEAEKVSGDVRLVILRTGIVLSTKGGMLQKLLLPFNLFVGGPVGSGQQCLSWIHIDDEVDVVLDAIDNPAMKGPINLVAPNPVSMHDFARTLGSVMSRPSLVPVPRIAVQLLMGEGAEYAVKGQNVAPHALDELGFRFSFADLRWALKDLIEHNK